MNGSIEISKGETLTGEPLVCFCVTSDGKKSDYFLPLKSAAIIGHQILALAEPESTRLSKVFVELTK